MSTPAAREAALDEVGHRQHGRAGVEAEAAALEACRPAHRDRRRPRAPYVVPGAGQVAGGRQPAEAGADDDDRGVTSRGRSRPRASARLGERLARAGRARSATAPTRGVVAARR